MRRKKYTAARSVSVCEARDDLRKRRKLITLIDGPLVGKYYVNNLYAYLCLPNVDRTTLLEYNKVGYKAKEWLYYLNTGSNSKHKSKGTEYKLDRTVSQPIPTVLHPYSCVIEAAKAAWVRGEFRLYRYQY